MSSGPWVAGGHSLASGQETDTAIWSAWKDLAEIVTAEKRTRATAGEHHHFPFRLNLVHHLIDKLASMVRISVDDARFAENVQFFRLDNKGSLAARPALVTFVLWHVWMVAHLCNFLMKAWCFSVAGSRAISEITFATHLRKVLIAMV
jgi:hypothetical protein